MTPSSDLDLPTLPWAQWKPTKTSLHLWSQILGKIRLALHPKLNHWWHVPFYVSPRGLTTGSIPVPIRTEGRAGEVFEMELDLTDHRVVVSTSGGRRVSFHLTGQSVAEVYRETLAALGSLGIEVKILARPFDLDSELPFAEDREPRPYDPELVRRFHRLLTSSHGVFETFRGRFLGKVSPVHFFWHSFDLAVTRFSGRPATVADDADPVTREAYSHEVVSAGFWSGDDTIEAPAYYCYTHPSPEGLTEASLRPAGAFWDERYGGPMALLMVEDLKKEADPRAALLDFLQSSYEAGADRAGWDREALE